MSAESDLAQQAALALEEWARAQGDRSVCRLDGHDAAGTALKALEGASVALKEAHRAHLKRGLSQRQAVDLVLGDWEARRNPARGGLWSAYLSGGIDALLHARAALGAGDAGDTGGAGGTTTEA